jgi:TonB-linked SusC/RagA family outer membrane protein
MRKLNILLVLLLFSGMQLLAQRTITGKVTSADDGLGIPGVTVVVKGTNSGALTDMDGKYQLTVTKTATSLVYTFVGMKTVEATLGASNVLDITMESEAKVIEGVVVTAFGITRQAKELGYATAKVTTKELTRSGASNVVNGLSAKVSGLQINTVNNGVNPDTRITLRGNRHFLASNQALVVLDGVPVSATFLNTINPNDIESVNVLKGASASALYGNDASNGVLMVTTKKGSSKPEIKVSNTTTFESISYLPKLQDRFGSGSGETTANNIGGNVPDYTFWIGPDRNTDPYTSYENQSYGPEFNGSDVILGGVLADGSYQMVPYSAIKNQKKKFFNTGVSTQNDVSYSMGDAKSNFYISAQDVNTKGTIPNDKNRRTSLRFAGGKTYGIFHSDFSLGYTQTNTNVSGGEPFQGRPVYWNVLNTPAQVPLTEYQDVDNDKFAQPNGYFNAYYPNPYWQTLHSRNITRTDDVLGSLLLTLKPAEWINISYRAGLTTETYQNYTYRDEVNYNSYMVTDPWGAGHNASGKPVFPGASTDGMSNSLILTGDFLVSLNKKFSDITTNLILGNSMYSNKYKTIGIGATSLVIPGLYNVANRLGEATVTEQKLNRASAGVFADLTLGYKDFVFVHASARNDWDSRLAKDNRSFFYPGVDASLILSQIIPALNSGNSFVNFAKIRGGFSKTGQIALTNWYGTIPSFATGGGFPYGSQAGFVLSRELSNSALKPEITKEFEGGIELGFLKNRIHLEVNAYTSNTKDQTIPAQISAATGFTSALINAGELENKGIETDLRITPLVDASGFRWDFSINYSYNTSKVLSIIQGDTNIKELNIQNNSYIVIGEQFPAIKTDDVKRDPQGRIIVDPITGYPAKDPALKVVGHGNPNHILGVVNTFSYKGLSLNIVADYRSGNVIQNAVGNALDFTGTSWHSAQNGRQSFVIPNSVIETSPGVYVENTNVVVRNASRDFWVNSDYHNVGRTYVTSAAFWKLREVSINYDIPVKNFLNGTIKALQIGLVGRNLVMVRPVTNMWTDPEFNNVGGTSNAVGFTNEDQTPPTRVYGFTVKATF